MITFKNLNKMNSCSQCGSSIPEGQSICSMCMGDIGHGSDGYYQAWADEQEQKWQERQEQEEIERQLEEDLLNDHVDYLKAMDALYNGTKPDAQ